MDSVGGDQDRAVDALLAMSDPNHVPTHQTTTREPSVVRYVPLQSFISTFSNYKKKRPFRITHHAPLILPHLTPRRVGRTNAARRGVRASAPARGRATVRPRPNRASAATTAAESPISVCAAYARARAATAKRRHVWRRRRAATAATGQGHDDRSAGAI